MAISMATLLGLIPASFLLADSDPGSVDTWLWYPIRHRPEYQCYYGSGGAYIRAGILSDRDSSVAVYKLTGSLRPFSCTVSSLVNSMFLQRCTVAFVITKGVLYRRV